MHQIRLIGRTVTEILRPVPPAYTWLTSLPSLGAVGATILVALLTDSWWTAVIVALSLFSAFAFIAVRRLVQERDKLPDFVFGEPMNQGRSYYESPDFVFDLDVLWRIPVTNRGGQASDVTAKIEAVEPSLPHMPQAIPVMPLRLSSDKPADKLTFARRFVLATGETEWFDLAGLDVSAGNVYVSCATEPGGFLYTEGVDYVNSVHVFTVAVRSGGVSGVQQYAVTYDHQSRELEATKAVG